MSDDLLPGCLGCFGAELVLRLKDRHRMGVEAGLLKLGQVRIDALNTFADRKLCIGLDRGQAALGFLDISQIYKICSQSPL